MSFGADGPASVRHGAKFVQKILQGKLPKDMPIEQPTKFELAINLKTAKAIGLTIPRAFLQPSTQCSNRPFEFLAMRQSRLTSRLARTPLGAG